MKKKTKREKMKSWLLSHLHTAEQSLREVCMNASLSVSGSSRNGSAQLTLPLSSDSKMCVCVWGGGLLELFDPPTSTSEGVYQPLKHPTPDWMFPMMTADWLVTASVAGR